MKVGILGSGDVAKALGGGFLKHGHAVTMGTREPAKLADWVKQNPKGRVAGFADAAAFGELVVLSVKGTAALDVLRAANATNLAGKPVIDTTNPIADAPPTNGVLKFFTNLDESLLERLQREFADVRFVKAFNSVGNACMVNPQFKGGKPTMFMCGNDDAAKATVGGILDPVWLGNSGHGQSRGGPRDRATMHALVYSGLSPQRLGSRLQTAHMRLSRE